MASVRSSMMKAVIFANLLDGDQLRFWGQRKSILELQSQTPMRLMNRQLFFSSRTHSDMVLEFRNMLLAVNYLRRRSKMSPPKSDPHAWHDH